MLDPNETFQQFEAIFLGILALLLAWGVLVGWNRINIHAWKVWAFVGCAVFPLLAMGSLARVSLDKGQKNEFCLSCHAMEPYGESLQTKDSEYIPAVHYQNNWVSKDKACYSCHTDYTWYGDYNSKFRGFRHLVKNITGPPAELKLYQPYKNRECLSCHAESRNYLKRKQHRVPAGTMEKINSDDLSCMAAGCHDVTHEVDEFLDNADADL